jgi:molybdenum cofactor synthesis domain-containing protein
MTVLHGDFKTGLETFLFETSVRAILLGTRRGDPNAPGQETFCPSSKGWPAFMRVNPILEWTYHDVWLFLRCASLPYCSLYDRGYTSVGSVSNTHPNEALAREDGTFAPAHMLPDARLERAGRGGGAVLPLDPLSTVGIVIIGDEILSAKVDDVNMKFLCGELRSAAFFVDRAMFVRDDIEAIAAAVREFSEDYDAVITAGGLGPTPDDVTCLGIAEAFGRQVGRHPELEARIRAYFGADVTDSHLKMADTPMGPEILLIDYNQADGTVSPFPLLKCRNVYILPGIPSLVQQKWRAVKKDLISHCGVKPTPYHSVVLRLKLADEATVAAALEKVTNDGGDFLAVGSYPVSGQSDGCEVVLSLESKDVPLLEKAREQLVELLPPGVVQSEHRDADMALNSPIDAPTVGINLGDKVLRDQ